MRRQSTQNGHRADNTQTTLRGNGCEFRRLAPNMTNSGGMCISWEPSTTSDTNMDLLVLDIQSDKSQRDLAISRDIEIMPRFVRLHLEYKQVHVSI